MNLPDVEVVDLGLLLVTLAAAVISIRANRIAGKANRTSQDANDLSTAANQLSSESNSIAREANEIAKEATAVVKTEANRQQEAHDVHWDWDWADPGKLEVVNRGQDPASEVRIVVTLDDGAPQRTSADKIHGGERIEVDVPDALSKIVEDQRERERRSYGFNIPSLPQYHSLKLHVTWKTELGSPQTHDGKPQMFSFD